MTKVNIGESTTIPLPWLIVALFVGGSALVGVSVWAARTESLANDATEKVKALSGQYNDIVTDISNIKTSLGRIEQKLDDMRK